jgi:hypothetical protein
LEENIDILFENIRKRFKALPNSSDRNDLLLHLRSIARWNREPMDYPELRNIEFPSTIHVAHAVCHPECGTQEFIVDGGTQRCQRFGGLMFRGDVKEYTIKP